jgi:hypothetical protein
VSISNFLETKLLDLVFNGTAYAGQSTVYAKLHTGDPGEDGTANAATNTTRQAMTFGAASGGTITNDADVTWTSVPASEDYTHLSLWDALSGGNCVWTGTITANAVTAGDTFVLQTGNVAVALD